MEPRNGSRIIPTQNAVPTERRRSPRYNDCTAVSLCSVRGEYPGMVINVSADGMFIQTPVQFFIGEILDLAFTYRSKRWTLSLKVDVVRITPSGIGVQMITS